MNDETAYRVALSRVAGIGPARTRALLDFFGGAEEAWLASGADLQMAGLDPRTADNLLLLRRSLDLEKEMARLEQAGVRALTWESEEYPERLKEAPGCPAVLYILGELTESDRWAVGVVGTRRFTAYGHEVTERLSADLAQAGVTVISGLARGIDTFAHRAALDAGGRTVAVLGSGLDAIYTI